MNTINTPAKSTAAESFFLSQLVGARVTWKDKR